MARNVRREIDVMAAMRGTVPQNGISGREWTKRKKHVKLLVAEERAMPDFNDPTVGRRQVVYCLGSVVAVGLFGPTRETANLLAWSQVGGAQAVPPCVVTPQQMEGPYFVDERLNRADIRADPSNGGVKDGVPLHIRIRLSTVSAAGACTPLAGALVDVWQCDALGVYSDVKDRSFDTRGQKFLRGYQVSDPNGHAQFTTIYPGWYPGRAVHVHFKVRTNPSGAKGAEFTSQLYFDEKLTDVVHAQAPYNTKGRRNTSNEADKIFRSGGSGSQLVIPVTADGKGYAGTFDVGVKL
jgi:protocatechuate 3,4-dioxygenase beta subunit